MLFFWASCGSDDTYLGDFFRQQARYASDLAKQQDSRAVTYYVISRRTDAKAMNEPKEADMFSYWSLAQDDSANVLGTWRADLIGQKWTISPTRDKLFDINVTKDITQAKIDVTEAWALVKKAGLAQPFYTIELFYPLHPTKYKDFYYLFSIGPSKFIVVNANTGEVTIDEALNVSPVGKDISDWAEKIINAILPDVKDYAWKSCRYPTFFWMSPPISANSFYIFGDGFLVGTFTGTGGIRKYATYTYYYPLDLLHSKEKSFNFQLYTGSTFDTNTLIKSIRDDVLADYYAECLGLSDADTLVFGITDFCSKYGDFAINIAYTNYSSQSHLYINLLNPDLCNKAVGHGLPQAIKGQMKGKPSILCGDKISAQWNLNTASPIHLLSGTPLYIVNTLGTLNTIYFMSN